MFILSSVTKVFHFFDNPPVNDSEQVWLVVAAVSSQQDILTHC